MRQGVAAAASAANPLPASRPASVEGRLSLDEQECRVIEDALDRAGGNQVQAARILGITRDKLRYKIKKHNLR
jgi:DNA-binding NtrC family response regulator